jgi:hypothetical protein
LAAKAAGVDLFYDTAKAGPLPGRFLESALLMRISEQLNLIPKSPVARTFAWFWRRVGFVTAFI